MLRTQQVPTLETELFPYEWTWEWSAKEFTTSDKPGYKSLAEYEAELKEVAFNEATNSMIDTFLKEGYPLRIDSIETTIEWVTLWHRPTKWWDYWGHQAYGTTIIRFATGREVTTEAGVLFFEPLSASLLLGLFIKYVAPWIVAAIIAYFAYASLVTIQQTIVFLGSGVLPGGNEAVYHPLALLGVQIIVLAGLGIGGIILAPKLLDWLRRRK